MQYQKPVQLTAAEAVHSIAREKKQCYQYNTFAAPPYKPVASYLGKLAVCRDPQGEAATTGVLRRDNAGKRLAPGDAIALVGERGICYSPNGQQSQSGRASEYFKDRTLKISGVVD
ncbi:hypothetical protein J6590_088674 [Homalodisca vitripennis]|nr:hypothetical protein J6590_088674 [Homalodisca vitripennis]